MIIKFWRESVMASCLLTIIRIYLGWQWLASGWDKISGGKFDATGFLRAAVNHSNGDNPAVQPWWADFLNYFAIPNAGLFNLLVPWGEFLVGLGLIIGMFTSIAALMGIVMNFSYLFSGTTSTGPQMVLLEILILAASSNAAKLGFDRWVIPFLRAKITNKYSMRSVHKAYKTE
ncbi:DoxX family protein [Paenibacillus sepulcri]|uniref:DoxX family protein n=1 Tax=Paenibacillus sepulcri TaxID=359917 RepID=A0ABS7C425_9BACL|nr:DoxX family protein [Paenibacillus sepulcri]